MKNLFSLCLLTLLFAACVPQQQYAELEQTMQYYKTEALATDSIRGANIQLQTETSAVQADYQKLTRELESLTATNISLNRNYQDVVDRYNSLVGDNQRVLEVSSYETATLEQELALRQAELDQKEQSLSRMETQLRSRDRELQQMEARGYNQEQPQGYNAVVDSRFQNLQAQKAQLNQQRDLLINYFQRVLVGFPETEVNIEPTTSGVNLTLSENLLFYNGDGAGVYWKGRQALQQIAVVLRDNPELAVQVISHMNPSANPDADWEQSIFRALTIGQDLVTFGINPSRMQPTGKGSNEPIVPATNSRAQLVNGRTVISVNLDYSTILQALD